MNFFGRSILRLTLLSSLAFLTACQPSLLKSLKSNTVSHLMDSVSPDFLTAGYWLSNSDLDDDQWMVLGISEQRTVSVIASTMDESHFANASLQNNPHWVFLSSNHAIAEVEGMLLSEYVINPPSYRAEMVIDPDAQWLSIYWLTDSAPAGPTMEDTTQMMRFRRISQTQVITILQKLVRALQKRQGMF